MNSKPSWGGFKESAFLGRALEICCYHDFKRLGLFVVILSVKEAI
jgi:hypothetical protein